MLNNNKSFITKDYFVSNLNQIISLKNLTSIKHAANYFEINERRLKSWLYYERVPCLNTLDKIANHLNIETYKLIKKKFNI